MLLIKRYRQYLLASIGSVSGGLILGKLGPELSLLVIDPENFVLLALILISCIWFGSAFGCYILLRIFDEPAAGQTGWGVVGLLPFVFFLVQLLPLELWLYSTTLYWLIIGCMIAVAGLLARLLRPRRNIL